MLSTSLRSLRRLATTTAAAPSTILLRVRGRDCSKLWSSRHCVSLLKGSIGPSNSNVCGAFHSYIQNSGFFTSRSLWAEGNTTQTPTSSPLIPPKLSENAGKSDKTGILKPSKVQAVLKGIRQSPKKVNLVAKLVRGMRVEDALLQLQVTVKRAAKTVFKVIKSARANASHNHGFDPDRLIVEEAFVGKGMYLKRISYHAKGRSGIMVRPHCRLTVILREITEEEEAKIAKIRVMNYKKLTRKEKQLVPHQLIEASPTWSRRPKEPSIYTLNPNSSY